MSLIDPIDRYALIHELNNSHYPGAPYIDAGISIAIGKVWDAPTIEPERKPGKWILVTDNNGQHFICDHCGEWRYRQNQKVCGECGADMRGEQE